MRKRLIIAGGGIGGIAAALAAHRAGIDVSVFERAPAFSEVGAGMSLWPNATRVLQSLGMLDQVLSLGEPVTQFNLRSPDGKLISAIPMAGFSTPAICIHRADLHRTLRQPLPAACLEPNQRLTAFVQDSNGVTAKFASGIEAGADGLIGADGIHSVVRSQMHGADEPIYRGYCIWRCIAPDTGGTTRGHISETWGSGRRFGIMPIGRGRVCWYATHNRQASQPDAPELRKADVQALFRGWHDPISSLIEAANPADIIRTDACDRRPLRQWGSGRVTLLGDAAHPMTPNVGQGACMAIEDAAVLAKCLLGYSDVALAFRSYQARRGPRTVRGRNLATRLILSCSQDMHRNPIYAHQV
jgi:2-polyprenyl-6-methoxyphenol hydroxylase-like FAD-dependent oxidoreductase